MKLERSIAIQQQLENNINDLISQAKMFGLSSAEMSKRYNALFDRYPKTLPGHVKSYARGYYHALWNNLYRADLVHGYRWNGSFFTNWDTMPAELKEHIKATPTDKLDCGHYWKRFIDKQEYKQF